jgi:signal transduction histidine kinase
LPESGVGEIGELQRSFNTMAASLQRSRDELIESRTRLVLTADETRRRFERDLHDGAQQSFVSVALRLRSAQVAVPPEMSELTSELDDVADELGGAIDQLRSFAQGIHPTILVKGGLVPAVRKLADQSVVPVELDLRMNGRLPEQVEVGAYYVVAEALTNAAKHGHASLATVRIDSGPRALRVTITDDGVGGAQFGRGSGLVGLKDRVEALGGTITLESATGAGTSVSIELPVDAGAGVAA